MKLMPELLLHPNMPKPLHGIAPRIIKGDNWWDEQRQIAYKKNNYCCWACGVNKKDAKYHRWLESHEIYEFNYSIGEVKFIDICALCHCCHNFIHNGRMYSLLNKGELEQSKFDYIIRHGFDLLIKNNLPLNIFAVALMERENWYRMAKYKKFEIQKLPPSVNIGWDKWYMLIDNKKYYSKFKNFDEWNKFYNA